MPISTAPPRKGRSRRRTALAAVATAAALTAAGCTGAGRAVPGGTPTATPASLQGYAAQHLSWGPCAAPRAVQGGGAAPSPPPGGGTWQCATMLAPLDYAKPSAGAVRLALIRARARPGKDRIGSLLFNFGGPGASGVAELPSFAKQYRNLRTRYDLVGFDPRGVGASDGVTCESNRQLDVHYAQDALPDTVAEERAYARGLKDYAAGCKRRSGRLLRHVGTTDAARDMDLMRQVLGDRKLYYFGYSYGTELGAVYAHLYPRHVGRAVLDGVVDPTHDTKQSSLAQAEGFQLALHNFAQNCIKRGDACKIPGATPDQIEKFVGDLVQQLEEHPVPASGRRKLTQTEAVNGIAQALYSRDYWPLLEQGIDEAHGGNGALLLALSDAMNGRDQLGRYSNIQAANAAVNCVDSKERYSLAQTRASLPAFRRVSPEFGDFLGWGLLQCTAWPVRGRWSRPDVSAHGSAPILVVGNTGDPATPYAGARAMVRALGKGVGVEVTYKGQGHGAYITGNTCVHRVVDAYLLHGKVPKPGTTCR